MNHLVLQYSKAEEGRLSLTIDQVLQAITDVHNAGQAVTRAVVAEVLGVPVGKIDEHTKNLIREGQIRRISSGVYEPVFSLRPSRPVSVKRFLTGMVEITVGPDSWTLTPEEERMLAASITGASAQFHDLARGRDLADRFRDLQQRHRELQEEVRRHLGIAKQVDAFDSPP